LDVRFGKIVALEEEFGVVGFGAGVGETIADVERRRVPALAEFGVGFGSQFGFMFADGDVDGVL
jgi:hypothetical protein